MIQIAEKPSAAAAAPTVVAAKPPPLEAAAAVVTDRRPAWMWPVVMGSVLISGMVSIWALGVFSAKDKGSLEVAPTKSPSSPGPLVGVRTPAPPAPPLAPNPDVNKSREVVRVPESRKNDASALEELASNRVPVRTRDFATPRPAAPPPPPEPMPAETEAESPAAKPSLVPAALVEQRPPGQLMQHAIKILRDIPIVKNRQKDALRDKAVLELNEAIKSRAQPKGSDSPPANRRKAD